MFQIRLSLCQGPSKGLRPVLALQVLNKYLQTLQFKMLRLGQLLTSVSMGDWFAMLLTLTFIQDFSQTAGSFSGLLLSDRKAFAFSPIRTIRL